MCGSPPHQPITDILYVLYVASFISVTDSTDGRERSFKATVDVQHVCYKVDHVWRRTHANLDLVQTYVYAFWQTNQTIKCDM